MRKGRRRGWLLLLLLLLRCSGRLNLLVKSHRGEEEITSAERREGEKRARDHRGLVKRR